MTGIPGMEVGEPLRVMCYGVTQTKKTWWAAKAAEAGFNVLYLEGDGNPQTLMQVDAKARHRIRFVNMRDKLNDNTMSHTLTHLLFKGQVFWNATDCKVETGGMFAMRPGKRYFIINVSKLTPNDVLVLDSHTALVQSAVLQFALENDIDLSDAKKIEWEGYGWMGNYINAVVAKLKALPCHHINIAHEVIYEKKKKDKFTKKEEVEWTKTIIKSSSAPNAMQMTKNYGEVLHFKFNGANQIEVDSTSSQSREGGSRCMAAKKLWSELQFIDIIKAAGCQLPTPDAPMPGCVIIEPDQVEAYIEENKPKPKQLPIGGQTTQPNLSNLNQNAPVVSASTAASTAAQLQPKVGLAGLIKKN